MSKEPVGFEQKSDLSYNFAPIFYSIFFQFAAWQKKYNDSETVAKNSNKHADFPNMAKFSRLSAKHVFAVIFGKLHYSTSQSDLEVFCSKTVSRT